MDMRGSHSSMDIEKEGALLYFLLLYLLFDIIWAKPAMGFCFARLVVQPDYDDIVEDGIPRILSHIGPQTLCTS